MPNKTPLHALLKKELIDYFQSDERNVEKEYNVHYDKNGLHFTTITQQFISNDDIKKIFKKRKKCRKSQNNKKLMDSESLEKISSEKKNIHKKQTDIMINETNTEDIESSLPCSPGVNPCDLMLNAGSHVISTNSSKIKSSEKQTETNKILQFSIENETNNFSLNEIDTLESLEDVKIETVHLQHINMIKLKYGTLAFEHEDEEFFRTITEDTIGYLKSVYEIKLLEIYNKVNNKNKKKLDFTKLLKKKFESFYFSTVGSSYILFNRIDVPFISAWHEYLEYLTELNFLSTKKNIIGFFKNNV
ncbi:uncharacterized protein VNE69_03247 [Vairimorpha necatrix]|uniref:Uncharacterized protein n=1 Tax=Vairimorpha necatrix TaxID=6039 RepID=A0AAX4JAR6_9MICR